MPILQFPYAHHNRSLASSHFLGDVFYAFPFPIKGQQEIIGAATPSFLRIRVPGITFLF